MNVGDSGSMSAVLVTLPSPALGVAHCAVFAGVFTPTALEQSWTETVLVDAAFNPVLLRASVDTVAALGGDACAGDELLWIAYSAAFLVAEVIDVATIKK